MIRIRFRRVGLKRQPSYRIVVIDQRKARDGGVLEVIGHHNPRTQPSTDIIEDARALYWLSVGAQPTDAVKGVMRRVGTWDRFERLRKGEDMEALVAEAEAARAESEPVSPKTAYPAPAPGKGAKAAIAAAEAEAAAQAEEAAAEETEAEATEA